MKNEDGFVLAATLFAIPLALAVLISFYYIARTGNVRTSAQTTCNRAALENVEAQARGLEQLARINKVAWALARLRQGLTIALAAGSVAPPAAAAAADLLQKTILAQKIIDRLQKAISLATPLKAINAGRRALTTLRHAKVTRAAPSIPNGPHRLPMSLLLHVRKVEKFSYMQGAPLELDPDFSDRQGALYELRVDPKSFVEKIRFTRPAPLSISCEARVKMKKLEEKWIVQLVGPEARFSSNLPSVPSFSSPSL